MAARAGSPRRPSICDAGLARTLPLPHDQRRTERLSDPYRTLDDHLINFPASPSLFFEQRRVSTTDPRCWASSSSSGASSASAIPRSAHIQSAMSDEFSKFFNVDTSPYQPPAISPEDQARNSAAGTLAAMRRNSSSGEESTARFTQAIAGPSSTNASHVNVTQYGRLGQECNTTSSDFVHPQQIIHHSSSQAAYIFTDPRPSSQIQPKDKTLPSLRSAINPINHVNQIAMTPRVRPQRLRVNTDINHHPSNDAMNAARIRNQSPEEEGDDILSDDDDIEIATSANAGPSASAGPSTNSGPSKNAGPSQHADGDFDCWGHPNCPCRKNPRKVLSHFFGRNKTETKRIPKEAWLVMCRQHYQRGRYRNTRQKSYGIHQLAMLKAQLNEFRRHLSREGPIRWVIQYQSSLNKLVEAYATKVAQSPYGQIPPPPTEEIEVAYTLRALIGHDKTTSEVRDYIDRMEAICKPRLLSLAKVEFLPRKWGKFQQ